MFSDGLRSYSVPLSHVSLGLRGGRFQPGGSLLLLRWVNAVIGDIDADLLWLLSAVRQLPCYTRRHADAIILMDRRHTAVYVRPVLVCFTALATPRPPDFFSNVPSGAPRISFRGHAGFRYVDNYSSVKGNGSQCSITERRVPELIPVLGSQPAGDVNHKPDGRLPLFSARPAVTPATFKRVLPISLLGEQEHSGCEQFAKDCYPTASRLRFEPGPFCA